MATTDDLRLVCDAAAREIAEKVSGAALHQSILSRGYVQPPPADAVAQLTKGFAPIIERHVRAAVARLRGETRGWRPIATAPKDGTPVLGFMPSYYQGRGGQSVMLWMDYTDRPGWYSDVSSMHAPTHWMPLPEAPAAAPAERAAEVDDA